ncbi:MAG: hypothetical protein HETSPECPRED_005479 [Heterodermia speciosa]|uniref:SRR1-like domain-containing protein n=1 Tax=Heterodermia speciosa TaxID=116794 RepID=A0A8H3FG64_9LECA|nr:MAG: hypothetical protein HETSPECPRED_005479 [Heterodermia speciosa]
MGLVVLGDSHLASEYWYKNLEAPLLSISYNSTLLYQISLIIANLESSLRITKTKAERNLEKNIIPENPPNMSSPCEYRSRQVIESASVKEVDGRVMINDLTDDEDCEIEEVCTDEDGDYEDCNVCPNCGENLNSISYTGKLGEWADPQPILPGMTIQTLQEQHYESTQKWENSEPGRISAAVLRGVLNEQANLKITSCVALGLGSFSGGLERFWGSLADAPMSQLVAFESWIKIIREHFQSSPKVYFQDPEFNDLDREFLTSLGYSVINTPASNDVLTEESFLFAPRCIFDVLWASLDHVFSRRLDFPALCLGVDIAELYQDECPATQKLLDAFLNQRESVNMALSLCHKEEPPTTPGCCPERSIQNWEINHPLYFRPDVIDTESIKARRLKSLLETIDV